MLKEMLLGCCQLEFDSRGYVIHCEHKDETCKYCKKRRLNASFLFFWRLYK
jgi:RNA polymerase sigma-70 factor (ECF subfamily)